ncbi:methyltransferase family protein [Gemmatimonadota bacterium]
MGSKLLPPKYLNAFFLLSIGLHSLLPIKKVVYPPLSYSGLAVIAAGIGLNLWSARVLRQRNKHTDFDTIPRALVTDGVFRFSRNPLYLGGVTVLGGIALFLGTLVTFVFPFALLLILDRFHIPFEERILEAEFGEEFREYRRRVRRWI